MVKASLVKGWCPDLFAPMQAADGWLVRIRPRLGWLGMHQLEEIADLAERFGNGVIELTNRANIQLRGFSPESAGEAVRIAVARGLVFNDPARERRSALLVSPLAGLDPACHVQTESCARALQTALLAAEDLDALPGKFSFAVDGGGWFPTGSLMADIMLQGAVGGWRLATGEVQTEILPMPRAVEAALELARRCIKADDGRTVPRPSREPETARVLLRAAGFAPLPHSVSGLTIPSAVGPLPGPATGLGAVMGRLGARYLRHCAEALKVWGQDAVRVTPWRSLIVSGLERNVTGFVTDPHDARLRVEACIGPSGCERAGADVGAVALFLAPEVPSGCTLHVSGCIKGCAHPQPASLTLKAENGLYDVVRNGRAADSPDWTHRTLPQVVGLLRTELEDTQT